MRYPICRGVKKRISARLTESVLGGRFDSSIQKVYFVFNVNYSISGSAVVSVRLCHHARQPNTNTTTMASAKIVCAIVM